VTDENYNRADDKHALLIVIEKKMEKKNRSYERFKAYDPNRYKIGRAAVFAFYIGKCLLTVEDERDKRQAHHLESFFVCLKKFIRSSKTAILLESIDY
jgi:hypothetical protein